jgi:hypothetical protein
MTGVGADAPHPDDNEQSHYYHIIFIRIITLDVCLDLV